MKKILLTIIFSILAYDSAIYAQLKLKVATNKDSYEYGEEIQITCSVINTSDSTITIRSGCTDSWQAEFEFNNYYSLNWSICLTMVQYLKFEPNVPRNYSWTIDPKVFGLPDKDGQQRIIGHFFHNNLTDTIYIHAPAYLGGQLYVDFLRENDTLINDLRNNLNVEVLDRSDYEWSDNISEIWQIYGFQIDSALNIIRRDDRILGSNYMRQIYFPEITVTSVEKEINLKDEYYLSNSYPNPFNSSSRFFVRIPRTEIVAINLYNSLGEEVLVIFQGELLGNSTYSFDINANSLPSGVYYFFLKSESYQEAKKIVLIK